MNKWFVYILRCKDNTLYTGITKNLTARIKAHTAGKGAKYTRGRAPFKLECCVEVPDKSTALKLESKIKKLSKSDKQDYINGYLFL